MEEEIKILEELKQEYSKGLDRLNDKDLSSCMTEIYKYRKKQVQAIENLIKSNKEKDTEINKLNKVIDKMAEYMEQEFAEYQLDEIYASLYKCNGMERNWTRGKEEELKDIKKYFIEEVENEKDKSNNKT